MDYHTLKDGRVLYMPGLGNTREEQIEHIKIELEICEEDLNNCIEKPEEDIYAIEYFRERVDMLKHLLEEYEGNDVKTSN